MPYACTRLRARFTHLLTPPELEHFHRCQTLAEVLPYLPDGDYATEAKQAVLDASDLIAWEAMLMAVYVHRLADACRLIQDVVPSYADLLVGEWDLHHLRCLFRRILRGGTSEGRRNKPSDEPASDDAFSLGADETRQSFVRQTFVPLGAFSRTEYEKLAESRTLADLGVSLDSTLPEMAGRLRQCLDPRRPADGREATSGDAATLEQLELLAENLHFQRQLTCAAALSAVKTVR